MVQSLEEVRGALAGEVTYRSKKRGIVMSVSFLFDLSST